MIQDIRDITLDMLDTTWPMLVISCLVAMVLRITYLVINGKKFVLYEELLKLFFDEDEEILNIYRRNTMSIKNMTKEDLELLSNKDITNLLLEEKGKQTTPDLFKKIIKLLELPESTFDQKIGDYYTSLTTDKRFILLEDGTWDLRSRHTSDKIIKVDEDEDEDIEEIEEEVDEEEETDDFDSIDSDDDDIDSGDDDLKDLVVLDEDEIEAE